jgi:predicted nucleic acid-binding protein
VIVVDASILASALARAPHGPLMARIWDLRDDLTPYDAAYVALAEAWRRCS